MLTKKLLLKEMGPMIFVAIQDQLEHPTPVVVAVIIPNPDRIGEFVALANEQATVLDQQALIAASETIHDRIHENQPCEGEITVGLVAHLQA